MPLPRRCPFALFAVFLFAVSLAWAQPAHAGGVRVRLVKRLWGISEVRVQEGAVEHVLDRFPQPVSVHGNEVSRDGHWGLVWYQEDRKPRTLAIYDLKTPHRTARLTPGFGGTLGFTPAGNIVHWWGCGTNCAFLRLYDVHGKVLRDDPSSGVDLSPSRHYVLMGPTLCASDEPLRVVNLDRNRSKVIKSQKNGPFRYEGVRWDEGQGVVTVELSYMDANRRAERLMAPLP